MSYNKKDIFTAISFMLFSISLAILITVFFKPLYYFDISYLGIDQSTGLDITTIRDNYDILIRYQSIFYQGSLHLPDFIMSEGGRIHFEEVKVIFESIQILFLISGVSTGICIYQQIKKKEYRFLRLTAIINIVIPASIGILAMVNFDSAFVIFHKLFFRNDFWIFDYQTDPIITILPQTFFMHCFIFILLIIVLISSICYGIYRKKEKQMITHLDSL